MKIQIAKYITLAAFSIAVCTSMAFADASIKENGELASAFSFTDMFKKVFGEDNSTSTATDAPESVMMMQSDVDNSATSSQTDERNSCEHFDNIVANLLTLESASADTKQKLDNVEDTLNSESALRDSILGSVKDFLGLQKKDKAVFKQMKKDISDARTYYANLDKKTDTTEKFLDENSCDEVVAAKAKKMDDDISLLVSDEASFRKQLVTGLKDEMKILQTGVQEAKK